MNEQAEAVELFDKDGDFSVFLTLHIKRYAAETGMALPDIFELFRKHKIPKKAAIHISFGGYESTKGMINVLLGAES